MSLRAFIGNNELDLPNNFSIPSEIHSPIFDFMEFRIGDFEMGISFPFTPQNKIAFGFANMLHQNGKKIKYPDFRVENNGEGVLAGTLILNRTLTNGSAGSFECDFFTNLFGIDAANAQLSEIMTKQVSLGSTPAAIVAAARVQCVAAMSTNGISGSVLKFIPTYAPDFYGDTNKDWMYESSKYRMESKYDPDSVVEFRLPEFTLDYPQVPADVPYAITPKIFRAMEEALAGESPFAKSGKWFLMAHAVFNALDEGTYLKNENYSRWSNTINRNALLPSIQVHDVHREIAKALGYKLEGQYMDDPIEQRALLFSNLALDKSSGSPNYIYVGQSEVIHLGPTWGGWYGDYNLQNGIYQNAGNLYKDYPMSGIAGRTYKPDVSGPYKVIAKARVSNNKNLPRYFSTEIWDNSFNVLGTNTITNFPANTVQNVDIELYVDLVAGVHYYPVFNNGDDVDFDILYTTFEVKNIETDFVNVFEGTVDYADHMPDSTVAGWLYAFQLWKNLYIGFDPLNRIMRMDYTDKLIKQNANMIELKDYQTLTEEIEQRRKRRFEMRYGIRENLYEKPANITELDAVAAVQDLPPPTQSNVCVLVKNTNAYYVTKEYDYGGRLFWDFAGYAWYDLKIEAEGELFTIEPNLGPVPMSRFQCVRAYETIGPVYTDKGRSAMYLPGGSRPGIQVMYWIGMDTTIQEDGVPYASTTGTTATGTAVLSRDMSLLSIYELNWKRTLQMLVLEELVTAHFHFPPEMRQLINFSRLFLLGHVPVVPIRRAEVIGSRASSGMEVEARKVKMEGIKIVSDFVQEEDGDAELFKISDLEELYVWLDGSDSTTLTHESNRLREWVNKGSIPGSADNTGYESQRPYVNIETLNSRPVITFNSSFMSFNFGSYAIPSSGGYTFIILAKFDVITDQNTIVDGSGASNRFRVYLASTTKNLTVIGGASSSIFPPSSLTAGGWFILSVVMSSTGEAYLNGISSAINPFSGGAATLSSIKIGCVYTQFYTTYFQGAIAQMAYFGGTNMTERLKAEGSLAWQYGMQGLLPVSHPYKMIKPTI